MSIAFLSPSTYLYRLFLHPALSWSLEPTVDRTLSGLYLRSNITLVMIFPQVFAAILRLYMLITGTLSILQQELMFKNLLFLYTFVSVILIRMMVNQRNWNSRELINCIIPYINCHVYWIKPKRARQVEIFRYLFIGTYLIIGSLLSSILIQVTAQSTLWVNNIATDIICCIVFFFVCRKVHKPTVSYSTSLSLLIYQYQYIFHLIPTFHFQFVRFGFSFH